MRSPLPLTAISLFIITDIFKVKFCMYVLLGGEQFEVFLFKTVFTLGTMVIIRPWLTGKYFCLSLTGVNRFCPEATLKGYIGGNSNESKCYVPVFLSVIGTVANSGCRQ